MRLTSCRLRCIAVGRWRHLTRLADQISPWSAVEAAYTFPSGQLRWCTCKVLVGGSWQAGADGSLQEDPHHETPQLKEAGRTWRGGTVPRATIKAPSAIKAPSVICRIDKRCFSAVLSC